MKPQSHEEIKKKFLSWYKRQSNTDPELPTNFDIADWWLSQRDADKGGEKYSEHDHSHCWESKNPPCGYVLQRPDVK